MLALALACTQGTVTKTIKHYNKIMDKDSWAVFDDLCVEICDLDESFEDVVSVAFDEIEKGPEDEVDSMGIPFLRRVLARIKSGHELGPINSVSKMDYDGKPCYRVSNYDYPTFKWAHKIGLGNMTDCRGIYILKSALSDSAIALMEKKIKKK